MANNKKRFKGNSPQLKNIYEVIMEITVLNGEKYPASKELIDTYDKDSNSNRTLFFGTEDENKISEFINENTNTISIGLFTSKNKAIETLDEIIDKELISDVPIEERYITNVVSFAGPFVDVDTETGDRSLITYTIVKKELNTYSGEFMAFLNDFSDDEDDINNNVIDISEHSDVINNISELIENSRNNIKMSVNDNFKGGN